MVQTCWLAEPSARPSFSNLKESLYNDAQFPKHVVEKSQGFYLPVGEESGALQKQYQQIQESNPMYNLPKKNDDLKDNTDKTVDLSGITISASSNSSKPENPSSGVSTDSCSISNCRDKHKGYDIPRMTQHGGNDKASVSTMSTQIGGRKGNADKTSDLSDNSIYARCSKAGNLSCGASTNSYSSLTPRETHNGYEVPRVKQNARESKASESTISTQNYISVDTRSFDFSDSYTQEYNDAVI